MLSAFWLVPTTDLIFIPSSRFKVFDSDGKRRLACSRMVDTPKHPYADIQ